MLCVPYRLIQRNFICFYKYKLSKNDNEKKNFIPRFYSGRRLAVTFCGSRRDDNDDDQSANAKVDDEDDDSRIIALFAVADDGTTTPLG